MVMRSSTKGSTKEALAKKRNSTALRTSILASGVIPRSVSKIAAWEELSNLFQSATANN
jgi:hypothetical protein